jgi:hypothetical protein
MLSYWGKKWHQFQHVNSSKKLFGHESLNTYFVLYPINIHFKVILYVCSSFQNNTAFNVLFCLLKYYVAKTFRTLPLQISQSLHFTPCQLSDRDDRSWHSSRPEPLTKLSKLQESNRKGAATDKLWRKWQAVTVSCSPNHRNVIQGSRSRNQKPSQQKRNLQPTKDYTRFTSVPPNGLHGMMHKHWNKTVISKSANREWLQAYAEV